MALAARRRMEKCMMRAARVRIEVRSMILFFQRGIDTKICGSYMY